MSTRESSAASADQGAAPTPEIGAATGLFQSLMGLASTLVTIASTRLELLTTELQEEIERVASVVVWAMIALFMTTIGLFIGGLTIVFVYWDTHRILASLLVTAGFFILALAAVLVLVAKINSRQRFLDATLTELAKDSDALKKRVQ